MDPGADIDKFYIWKKRQISICDNSGNLAGVAKRVSGMRADFFCITQKIGLRCLAEHVFPHMDAEISGSGNKTVAA